MSDAVGIATSLDPKFEPPDFSVEPAKDNRHLEVWLESKIIKELFPAYQKEKDAITPLEDELASRLACLKACVVGKGRDGKWKKYVEYKGDLIPVTLRTLDRWIRKAVESGSLPTWVMERLKPKKRSHAKVKMSVQLVFSDKDGENYMRWAVKELTKEKLAGIVLKAVRKELGDKPKPPKSDSPKAEPPTAEPIKSAKDGAWTLERRRAHGDRIKAGNAHKRAAQAESHGIAEPIATLPVTKLPPMHGQDRRPPTDKPNSATDEVVARLLHGDGVDSAGVRQ